MKVARTLIALSIIATQSAYADYDPTAAVQAAANQSAPTFYGNWMNSDVQGAWNAGYTGKGVTITVVDDYSNSVKYTGAMAGTKEAKGHGFWTSQEAGLVAPGATVKQVSYNTAASVPLAIGLNVINVSYGMFAASKYAVGQVYMAGVEKSIIADATNGSAVVVKAAGNDKVAVGGATSAGLKDFMAASLIGTKSAIFVGALDKNGTPTSKATLASYSNTAGSDTRVQNQFLVVGVTSSGMGLSGTSFAAPIVSGYAAVVGSKFTNANATQITNQLLTTARTDTINNYNAAVHGRGEASLSRALSPVAIK